MNLDAHPIHVVPRGDAFEHELSPACHCRPTVTVFDDGEMMVVHNSFDGREVLEMVERMLGIAHPKRN